MTLFQKQDTSALASQVSFDEAESTDSSQTGVLKENRPRCLKKAIFLLISFQRFAATNPDDGLLCRVERAHVSRQTSLTAPGGELPRQHRLRREREVARLPCRGHIRRWRPP